MEIERKDRNPTPFLGLPKKRVIRGLPKKPDPVAALRSLVPDFPENVDVPEYLWGRSQAKRVPPHMFRGHFESITEKAWRMRYQGKLYWLPKSQVFVSGGDIDIHTFNNYDVWVPHWLAKKNGMLEPEVTITITPEQQEGIDRLRREQDNSVRDMRLVPGPNLFQDADQHWRCTHCQAVNHNSRLVCRECHRAPLVRDCTGCIYQREAVHTAGYIRCLLVHNDVPDVRCEYFVTRP